MQHGTPLATERSKQMAPYTLRLDATEIKTLQDLLEHEAANYDRVGVGCNALDSLKTKVILAQLPAIDEPTDAERAYNHDTHHPGADSADGPAF